MMRTAIAVATFIALAVAAPRAQEPPPGQPPASAPITDRSLERMHRVLENAPLILELPDAQANFRVHIEAIHPLHEVFDKPLWQLDPIGWRPPGVGFNLLSVFHYAMKAASDAKRAHDERSARTEVQQAIDDWCAVQPYANRILLCASSPIPR